MYECPFCFFHEVKIILSESLLVGDAQQLNYSRTIDKAIPLQRPKMPSGSNIGAGAGATGALGAIGLGSGAIMAATQSPSGKASSEEDQLDFVDETNEGRP